METNFLDESFLKFYSLGIVVENKKRGSDDIKVCPIEKLFLSKGNIGQQKIDYKTTVKNARNVLQSSKAYGEEFLIARWIPFGHSNRITSPDVIKSETVIIFKYADTDEYYWTTIFREPSLRRQETVRYAYGNIKDGIEAWDSNSSYYFEVSTHDKYIHLHTSKNDGEPYAYDILLNTRTGNLTVKDDVGNSIVMNSRNNKISLTSVTVDINAKTTNVSNDLNVGGNLKVKKNTLMGSGGTGNLHVKGCITDEC